MLNILIFNNNHNHSFKKSWWGGKTVNYNLSA